MRAAYLREWRRSMNPSTLEFSHSTKSEPEQETREVYGETFETMPIMIKITIKKHNKKRINVSKFLFLFLFLFLIAVVADL